MMPKVIRSQNAPVTSLGSVTDAVPGSPSVPVDVTVTGFIDIGKFTLTLNFDTTYVHYVSAVTNPSFQGMSVNYSHPSGNSNGKIVIAWTGSSNVSLADGASLASLTFSYVSGTGIIHWAYTFGSVCQYKRYIGGVLTVLADSPKYRFYVNGGISSRGAPVTIAPSEPDPVSGIMSLPVKMNGFSDITSLTLYLEYDPAIITYLGNFTKNPVFDNNFLVGDSPGSGSKRLIIIQWYGSPINMPDGSTLCTLNFNYPMAICDNAPLGWSDSGPTCEFADGTGNVLIDTPQADYYINGTIGAGLPVTWTGNISSAWEDPGNWSLCGLPGVSRNIIIPDVSPNSSPVITDTVYCRSITIENGASLTIGSNGMLIISKD